MRLVRIRPVYFRGFGEGDWIELDASLVLLHSPNAYGKTSLAEALEWLLYGKTRRRERGEVLSRRDYQGSYRNAHAPHGSRTYVEAVFRDSTHGEHTVGRELVIGSDNREKSRTTVDDADAPFDTIGIVEDEIYNPVIPQDGLQALIHAKPKERRDRICASLGLAPLVRFKTVADRARTKMQSTPPENVAAATARLQGVLSKMNQNAALQGICQRWTSSQFEITSDRSELMQACQKYLATELRDRQEATAQLKARMADAERRVFDTLPIESPSRFTQDVQALEARLDAIDTRIDALAKALCHFLGTGAALCSQAQLNLWTAGLAMPRPEDQPNRCPVCEADTLTPHKRAELQQRIDQSSERTSASDALQEEVRQTSTQVRELARALNALFPQFMDDQQGESLRGLFGVGHTSCSSFLGIHTSAKAIYEQVRDSLQNTAGRLDQLPQIAAVPETAPEASDLVTNLRGEIRGEATTASEAAQSYVEEYAKFSVDLNAKISRAATVQEINALLAPLEQWEDVVKVAEYEGFLKACQDVIRQIEAHIHAKERDLVDTRGQEINYWYDLMNPGASVRYSTMEPGTDSLVLWAKSFGISINAAACLSQCQLNCLGLSVHLMRILTPGNPFKFLLLDDPVQSMDDDHYAALKIDVVADLLDRHLQLIVLSHEKKLIDSLLDIYYERSPRGLRISGFTQNGPTIRDLETLGESLKRAQRLAMGNDEDRRHALLALRRSIEILTRELCQARGSAAPPSQATAGQMLPYFEVCQGTTIRQQQGLKDSLAFSDPGLHTDPGWAVPKVTLIIPHVNRVKTMAAQLGLL